MFPFPINERPYYNTDPIANAMAATDMFDCYLEPVPGVGFVTRRRPGLLPFADVSTGAQGDGIFWWDAAQKCIAVSNGRVFDVARDGTYTDITGDACNAGVPVVFADGQMLDGTPWLYLASGKLVYTINGAATVAPTDANTPASTHVAWIDGRFVANSPGTPRFLSTDTNPATGLFDNAFWSSTINPFRNTARGDNIKALLTNWEEIYSWGGEALEVWQDDFATPFTSIPSALAEVGIEAPYSIRRTENTLFAVCVLDSKRVVVKLAGRAPVVISEPIAILLAAMPTVSDAIGSLITVGGIAIYLLHFPSANQTWAYDHKNDVWCRWGLYIGDSDVRDAFIGNHPCFCKAWNKHLIQSRFDGKIYELSRNAFDDAGTQMVPYRRTGWMDMTTGHRKRLTQFYIKGKPGLSIDTRLLFRYQEDGRNEWSAYTELAFDTESVERLTNQGTFRTRRYEFRLPSGSDTVLVSAQGSLTELRN